MAVRKLSENKNIQMNVSDPDNQIEEMLKYIKDIASSGHSFVVAVDPDDSDYKKEFWIDGDGACGIGDMKVEKEKEENEDD